MNKGSKGRRPTRLAKAEAAVEAAEREVRRVRRELERLARRIAETRDRAKRERMHARVSGRTGKRARSQRAAQQLAVLLEKQRKLRQDNKKTAALLREQKLSLKRERAHERNKAKAVRQVERLWGRASSITSALSKRVTGAQIRGARAMLGMNRRQFANLLGIPDALVRRLEGPSGSANVDEQQLRRVVETLEQAGIELIPAGVHVGDGGPGVRLRSAAVPELAADPDKVGRSSREQKPPRRARVAGPGGA